jgi:hypothetical protein
VCGSGARVCLCVSVSIFPLVIVVCVCRGRGGCGVSRGPPAWRVAGPRPPARGPFQFPSSCLQQPTHLSPLSRACGVRWRPTGPCQQSSGMACCVGAHPPAPPHPATSPGLSHLTCNLSVPVLAMAPL